MMSKTHYIRWYGLPLVIGCIALGIPLVGDLHIESALLASLVGCFWAGLRGAGMAQEQQSRPTLMPVLHAVYLTALPLAVGALATGCLSVHGIGFWILYPLPGILFGFSLGRFLARRGGKAPRLITVALLVFVAVGVLLIEFFTLPQVYFFNHVWGGWPGPIYDETVKVTGSLLFFRGFTAVWVVLFWLMGRRALGMTTFAGMGICLVVLVGGYLQLPQMGIITPRSYLKKKLPAHIQTAHFDLYFDDTAYSDVERTFLAARHESYFNEIVDQLAIDWPGDAPRIESYLYTHPWQKKALVGAKFTSYVPVWLTQDQLHIAKPQIARSLKHELVHVLAKQFGNKLLNASWSIGLIEGLAVAVAPDESPVTTLDQIVVSEKPYPTVGELRAALSPLGFYGGRSAVNYTQTGSFVQYLLEAYPVESLKQAYADGTLERHFPVPLDRLVAEWHCRLNTISVDATDRRVARRMYGFPSLFEQDCPHVVSPFAAAWDGYQLAMAESDTSRALRYLDKALELAGPNSLVKSRRAYLNLKRGNIEEVVKEVSVADTTADLLMLYADAWAMDKAFGMAQEYLQRAADELAARPDTLLQPALAMRQDSVQWALYRAIIYRGGVASSEAFRELVPRTRARALQQAIDLEAWALLERYAIAGEVLPVDERYFSIYIEMIEWLVFLDKTDLACRWIQKIDQLTLRRRYQERLSETNSWLRAVEE